MREKEETSILGIFQDPLLMLIALILLGTLWVVIPAKQPTPTQDTVNLEIKKEIDKFKEDIASIEKKIKELREEIDRLAEEINIMETREREIQKKKAEEKSEINRLNQEVAALKALLQAKKEKLKKLEKELEKARKQKQEAKLVNEIEQKIRELKKEINEREALLKKLEDKLKETRKRKIEYNEEKKGQEEAIRALQQQVDLEKEAVRKLEIEKGKLGTLLKERSGLGKYSTEAVKGKQVVGFEAVKNKLVLIDEKNYKIEAYRTMYMERIETAAKLTRKSSAKSESMDRIKNAGSEFLKELNKVKPETHFILFVVQKDSFKIFLAARQIAWQKGFAVSWEPWEGPINVGPGGDPAEGR